jgi:hypothetical protein
MTIAKRAGRDIMGRTSGGPAFGHGCDCRAVAAA